jgi:hypothetical protein
LWPSRRRQLFCAPSSSLKTMASAVLLDRHPFDRIVRWRTVAKVLSMGFVTGMRFLGANVLLRYLHRGVWCDHRDRGTGSTKCGQADAYDEPRARVSSWPPLRLARLRRERESVVVVSPAAPVIYLAGGANATGNWH